MTKSLVHYTIDMIDYEYIVEGKDRTDDAPPHLRSVITHGASSELIDRSSGRAESTSHTTHRDSKATTPYLLLGEQGLDTH